MAALTLYPAIDLKGGACVRLLKGEFDAATTYNDDPADQARRFAEAGFTKLHVVDLDGALAGDARNADAVSAILETTDADVQVGGGVRTMGAVEGWFERGVARVVLGTAAVRDPDFVRDAARAHPGRIVVGVDARGGKVAVSGWAETSELDAADLAKRFEDAGVAAIIFTDIDRDGALQGVNVEATAALADVVSIPVIASGGVKDAGDVAALMAAKTAHPGIDGVVIGRALYEGALSPAEAIRAAAC
ncbi:MAG: 1-(5-phosphoribosyl)-5-[(5-phosphoribosylamino)methylideneamino]imidazole-4-carboxamide isomerase [Pseudomonadota bacterium]